MDVVELIAVCIIALWIAVIVDCNLYYWGLSPEDRQKAREEDRMDW